MIYKKQTCCKYCKPKTNISLPQEHFSMCDFYIHEKSVLTVRIQTKEKSMCKVYKHARRAPKVNLYRCGGSEWACMIA